MSRVQPGSFLTLHYRLSGPEGDQLINTFDQRPATLSLGTGVLSPAIESRLLGMAEGSSAAFHLPAGEAFGAHNPRLVQRIDRAALAGPGAAPECYNVGDVVSFPVPDGRGTYAGVVREAAPDSLLFDFNHPLAGLSVTFEVQLIGIL